MTVGQKIGDGQGLCVPVHASVSGTVTAIEARPHPGGNLQTAIVIESDGRNTLCPTVKPRDPEAVAAHERRGPHRRHPRGRHHRHGRRGLPHVTSSSPPA